MIRAPYNFIPLSEKVYIPEWSKKITHDIPFRDGSSGCIDLKIENLTPIFVRNGISQTKNKDDSFSNVNDKIFIPATSIKGTIRNTLEILSFGKLLTDKKSRFTLRGFYNHDYKEFLNQQREIHCGWLKYDKQNSKYVICDCGKPYKVEHQNIDKYFKHKKLEDLYHIKGPVLKEEQKSSSYKYKLLELEPYSKNKLYSFNKINETNGVEFDDNGTIIGHLIVSGQASRWNGKEHKEKCHEYVFADQKNTTQIDVNESIISDFEFIYKESDEWNLIKEKLNKSELPVFFRLRGSGNNGNSDIVDLGLTYLYKLPYKNSPYELLFENHKTEDPDLAECIFGKITNSREVNSLKGRVQFTHAFMTKGERHELVTVALSSPKASYYPTYLLQEGRNGTANRLKSYNDRTPLAGWKRYVLKLNIKPNPSGNDKLDSKLFPVSKGANFESRIYYHNLRKVELGALLSALTFHNTADCYHQIGQGKPLGFGRVKITIKLNDEVMGHQFDELLAKFEEEISEKLNIDWSTNETLNELVALSSGIVDDRDNKFSYMRLDNNNEFEGNKKNREYLQRFSSLEPSKVRKINSYNDLINQKKEEEQRIEREKEEQRRNEEENIQRIERKKEEQRRIEEENIQRKKREESLLTNKLSFLDEKNNNGDFKVKGEDGFIKRTDDWLRKTKQTKVPEDQLDIIERTIKRVYADLTYSQIKRSKWNSLEDGRIWKKMRKWLNEEITREVYNRIHK